MGTVTVYASEDFEPIKRLFAAGNNCGGRFGFQYSTSIPGESLGLATARYLTEKGYHEYLPGRGQGLDRNAGICWCAKAQKTT